MKYFDTEKMGQIRNELEKEILQWARSLDQGDDGMPLLPSRQEHASVSRN
jgi:hypothetical protein